MIARIMKSDSDSHNSTKPVVGEIDTNPPIQSVKDAVSLFGEVAFSAENRTIKKSKSKPYSVESVWAKEAKLHLAQKELNTLKTRLKNAEATKAKVLVELEKSKTTVMDLKQKLNVLGESRESAIQATEASKGRAEELKEAKCGNLNVTNGTWKEELETAVQRYKSIITELDVEKQELTKIRQQCKESMEAKFSAFKEVKEAKDAMEANIERVFELFKEILAVQESFQQMKIASLEANQQKKEISSEKNVMSQSYKAVLEESENKLLALKNDFSLEIAENLEVKFFETMSEISALQKEIENRNKLDFESVKTVTLVLDAAKESLQKVSEEESSLRSLVEDLKLDLEHIKREHSELKEKERETESIVAYLEAEIEQSELELAVYLAEESKVRVASEEMILTLNQLSSQTKNSQLVAEEMHINAIELKVEAEVTKCVLKDAEMKLKVALEEAEAAKAAESSILEQIRDLSENINAGNDSLSEPCAQITISREEFDSLTRKVEDSNKLASNKVAAATAHIKAVRANEDEAIKKLEATQKEIEEIKRATHEALKKSELDEAAKNAVERELRRWRERDQKRAAETVARKSTETQMSPSSSTPSPYLYPQNMKMNKSEKRKGSVSKKVGGIFRRKKSLKAEKGFPSYLPGESPF